MIIPMTITLVRNLRFIAVPLSLADMPSLSTVETLDELSSGGTGHGWSPDAAYWSLMSRLSPGEDPLQNLADAARSCLECDVVRGSDSGPVVFHELLRIAGMAPLTKWQVRLATTNDRALLVSGGAWSMGYDGQWYPYRWSKTPANELKGLSSKKLAKRGVAVVLKLDVTLPDAPPKAMQERCEQCATTERDTARRAIIMAAMLDNQSRHMAKQEDKKGGGD